MSNAKETCITHLEMYLNLYAKAHRREKSHSIADDSSAGKEWETMMIALLALAKPFPVLARRVRSTLATHRFSEL